VTITQEFSDVVLDLRLINLDYSARLCCTLFHGGGSPVWSLVVSQLQLNPIGTTAPQNV
jgi:hypothetical protein